MAILAVLAFLATRAAADDRLEPEARTDPDDDEGGPSAGATVPFVDAKLPEAPPVASVVAAAERAAGLDRDPVPGWVKRARLAGLVPIISISEGEDAAWHEINPNIGRQTFFDVRATWHLDRLLFDTNELHAAQIAASRRREHRRVTSLAIRGYYTWRRAAAAATRDARWTSHADEAAAELDALTNGWFSSELTARRREMSEHRTDR